MNDKNGCIIPLAVLITLLAPIYTLMDDTLNVVDTIVTLFLPFPFDWCWIIIMLRMVA